MALLAGDIDRTNPNRAPRQAERELGEVATQPIIDVPSWLSHDVIVQVAQRRGGLPVVEPFLQQLGQHDPNSVAVRRDQIL